MTAAPVCCVCLVHLLPTAQPLGFALEGHPTPAFNGAYRKVSEHKGWPVLKNANGRYCYRHTPTDQWRLSDDRDDVTQALCMASIVAKEGPLPVGAHSPGCTLFFYDCAICEFFSYGLCCCVRFLFYTYQK